MNAKQARFVDEYLIDGNATQAAIRAGYSLRTARQIGQQNLSKLDIAEAVSVGQQAVAERNALTQDEVIAGLRREANWFGEDASHGARVTAFTQLGKHLGMFTDVVEKRNPADYGKRLDEAREQRHLRLAK